jgi:2-dehydro-3-deoxygluconokinase
MGGVVTFGECMVELSLAGSGRAVIGYAGDAFNTAVYLRRLGVATSFATALGDGDPFSAGILELMAAEGIGADLVARAPGRLPGLYAIERDETGERRFFYWRDQAPVRQFFDIADLGAFGDALGQADLFYFSGITLAVIGEAGRMALADLIAGLAARGVAVAFDPNYRARLWPSRAAALAAVEAVIPHCRLVSASGPDVEALCERPLAEVAAGWAELGPEVVARHDDRAVDVHAAGEVLRLAPPPPVRALDTTGAGDSFNAGFLAGWLKGATPERAVELGRAVAAQVVQHMGAIIPASAMPPPLAYPRAP